MSLEKTINDDIKKAMLAKDRKKLDALRSIKSALMLEKTGKDISSGEIPESVELKLLQKLVKQRRDSAKLYKEQGRDDLLEDEVYQAEIIEAYLHAQLSIEEVKQVIAGIIEKTGAKTMADMGKVMGMASKELAGKADNSEIAALVKELLG